MIAGEHGALADQREAEMVGCVPRQMQHVEREALASDRVAVGEPAVRLEGGIDEGIAETRRAGAARRAGRSERGDLAAEQRLQGARAVAMVAMAMRDEDMSEALAPYRGGDRLQMPLVARARIDDGDLAAADDVAVGAEEGIRARIVGDDAPDAGRDLLGDAVVDILTAIESKRCRHGLFSSVGLLVEPALL